MRLKLDENLGRPMVELFEQSGLDVATVHGEGMTSASDKDLVARAASEQRCLVTLDPDFAADSLWVLHRIPIPPSPISSRFEC